MVEMVKLKPTSVQWIASPALVTETVSSSRKLGSNEKFTVFVVAADQSSGHVTCADRFQF